MNRSIRYAVWQSLWLIAVLVALAARAEPPPPISARAAVLIDASSGGVLFARQPHQPLPPASTTKVLTALLALEHLDPYAKIPASLQAAAVEPSRIGLQAGETLYVQDLLYGLLLKSGNDAAEIVAEAVAGSLPRFAERMNALAWRLGARNSHFVNPHGLPDSRHRSSAYDLALIFRQAMQDPRFAEIVRTRSAVLRVEDGWRDGGWRPVAVRNTNRLLVTYTGIQGGKTGYTRAARNCFVGEASRDELRLIVAVLGSASRRALWKDVSGLLDYGFARYGLPAGAAVAASGGSRALSDAAHGDR